MNILFVTDKYGPKPLANAICAQAVADEFIKQGHSVHFLAYKELGVENVEHNKNVKMHYVKTDLRMKLFYWARNFPQHKFSSCAKFIANVLSKAKKMLFFPWYPFYSFVFPFRIFKEIEKIYRLYHIDLIISTYSPFDGTLGSLWFKKKYSDVKWCIYALDTFTRVLPSCRTYWLPKFLDEADLFIYMKSRRNEFLGDDIKEWRFKLKEADIPLLTDMPMLKITSEKKEVNLENWVYAGSIGKPHYDYSALVDCFLKLPNDKKRVLHFYTTKDEALRKIAEKSEGKIVCHEYVSHDDLLKIYQNADVLVSIKSSSSISAKVFEYISYGKKIVHFSGVEDDPDAQYIEKYSKGILITTYDMVSEKCAEQLSIKLKALNQQSVEDADNSSYFEMNRPEYTKNLILSYFY